VADGDARAIAWARKAYSSEASRGRYTFTPVGSEPPTGYHSGEYDLVYAGEAFARMGQALQHRWLCELRRVARCEAIVVVAALDGGGPCEKYLPVIERIDGRGEGLASLIVCQKPRSLVL